MLQKRSYRSSKLIQKKKRQFIIKLSVYIIFFITIISGLSFWSKHHSMQIEQIDIVGLEFANQEEVLDLVKQKLEGNYFFLFSKNNSLIFPRSVISKSISDNFASVSDLDIDLVNLNAIRIDVKEYQPVAFWCSRGEEGEQLESGQTKVLGQSCYLLNEDGLVFAKEPALDVYDFVKYFDLITADSGDPIRQNYLEPKLFQDFQEFNRVLRRLEIKVVTVSSFNNGESYEFETDSGTKIYIDPKDDLAVVYENLQLVLERDAINKAQFRNLEYIDLRFGNRVFYKLK